ncbi:MAG: formate dehydrogenase subunit gamma [Acidobacteria bacterium]|nr:formate dehydrogenase subunit gamma [Acidobacteriota bacterium]MBF85903.1 formate dehydrogenase subunit gamma [Acidobacteriota bacterium]MCH2278303.1 formate dehydrogenase subunit gamma [Vicinamibacterales bacterium]MEC7767988.1 formate dehydrogenase subunit gamma [Acidobacteriota bacterium]|tara:strand:- start:2609 stop:3277 length:669 start_codon:yes stop_codon:yes gene_type:complete
MTTEPAALIHRFNAAQRLIHWAVGISFTVLFLTGLAFSYPSLFWLTNLLGGGPTARALHPWVGLVFSISMAATFSMWMREMSLDATDWHWLRAIRAYAQHQTADVPPAGKYNGGQKLFFWAQTVLGVVLLISGLALWFPNTVANVVPTASTLLASMRLVHYAATLAGGLLLTMHVYLGLFAFPGTARGMIDGKVTRAWATMHHSAWEPATDATRVPKDDDRR